MPVGKAVHFSDEMRLGLPGQTRRVLARRGVKPVQRLQLRYEWSYLLVVERYLRALAADPERVRSLCGSDRIRENLEARQ